MKRQNASLNYWADHSSPTMDDKISSLFQPDTLLPAEFFANLRRRTLLQPEMQLMFAVLEDAINCFQDNLLVESGKGKRLFNEAEEWIFDENGDWIFSFRNVCELLGFDPAYLRRGLLRWKLASQRRHSQDCQPERLAG